MIGLANLVRRGDTVTSEIGLKFGSMKARVDSSQGPNEFHISTPEGTLSVRGSFGRVSYFVDKGLNFCDVEGIWRLNTNIGKTNVQPGECTDNKLTPSTVISSRHRDTRMGDPNGGTTRKEEDNLRNNGGGRGIFSFSGSSNNQVKLYGNPPMPSPSSSSGSCQCPNGGESSGN
jgi:hypothetical protein